jgi:hypothetical protein
LQSLFKEYVKKSRDPKTEFIVNTVPQRENIRGIRSTICIITIIAILLTFPASGLVLARQGDSGYEGGISSGEAPNKISYQYQEPSFISGTPVILSGTLLIKKSLKTDAKTSIQTLTTTYTYALKNGNNKLDRKLVFTTTITPQDNGQKTESTQLKTATETLVVDGSTYTIANVTNYELSKSILNDLKPAVNYYAGELWSRKTYSVGTGAAKSTDTVVVENTGKYYGYDEYWSSAETQVIEQTITKCSVGKDPVITGTIDLDVSTTTSKQLKYYENQPDQISFAGGYVQSQKNENILKYTAKMKELDKNKAVTGKDLTFTKTLKLESFPVQTRLVSKNLKAINGHPSQESITLMFGLEAFKDTASFDPQEYMSRAEFIDAFVNVAKEVPLDPVFNVKKRTTATTKNTTVKSLFTDVSTNHTYFTSINSAATRGIVVGNGKSKFRPEALITLEEAVTMIVNSLGLDGLAPNPAPVTSFKDNDKISSFARPSMYVAEKIGLIQEDAKGYINPQNKITKAKAADIMKAYIDYMNSSIRSEYMDKIVSY